MPRAYYNEFDPYAAQWLRNLIAAGHIAPGDVDQRSVEDVAPLDLAGYTQCHFFAGIGVWSYALRRAGWADSRPAWTGSCPCQPFSAAGKGNGFADERHLWPSWHYLIGQRNPVVVFGEQVSSKDADIWVDLVQTDMEALGYAFGAVSFPSAGVGAPHIRDRLYWVADADDPRLEGFGSGYQAEGGRLGEIRSVAEASQSCRVGHAENIHRGYSPDFGRLCCEERTVQSEAQREGDGTTFGVASDTDPTPATGPLNGRWANADWLYCRDGKWRPVEPSTFPLANGSPARVGRLRAYGNAIVAQAAEAVIRAYMECRP